MLSRMKNQALGSMTPRSSRAGSGFFSKLGKGPGGKLFLSKSAKGSIVAAAMMRISKRSDSGWQDRFVIVVGDVLLIFMLATQPDLPLGLRLWPAQVVCLNMSSLALPGSKLDLRSGESVFTLNSKQAGVGAVSLSMMAEDAPTMQRFARAMQLGVSNVRRSRQQAKLSLAQQMCQ